MAECQHATPPGAGPAPGHCAPPGSDAGAARCACAPRPWVELRQVTVRYGALQALAAVTLRVLPGERLALVGANGSGKSTLLRVLHGLAEIDSGSLHCDRALRQAMLFQRPHMLRTSAQNNVALALWLRGARWRAARQTALAALARVGLQELAGQNARTLSGGQQQRLALARAWALAPQVLLLDEPTASLDPHAKREVEALMAGFAAGAGGTGGTGGAPDAQRRGASRVADLAAHSAARNASQRAAPRAPPLTMVFSSHNLGQVKRLASRVLYLEHGRLVADLPVHDFFHGPLPEAARLFVKGELV